VDPERLIRMLRKHGWTRTEGTRHTLMRRGDLVIAVPRHGPLGTGLVSKILRDAGISIDQANREL
jgi:predicted RNA binding protein YcfA (HicA-like mRNA interferase family)